MVEQDKTSYERDKLPFEQDKAHLERDKPTAERDKTIQTDAELHIISILYHGC